MNHIIRNSRHKNYSGCQDYLNEHAGSGLELVNVISITPLYTTELDVINMNPSEYAMLSVWRKY